MIIKNRHMRRYLRGWCRRAGVQYSRKVWLVRKQSGIEREAERIAREPIAAGLGSLGAKFFLRTRRFCRAVALQVEREYAASLREAVFKKSQAIEGEISRRADGRRLVEADGLLVPVPDPRGFTLS